MHVPGVKQEQPDRKPDSRGPVFVDMVIRDGDNSRLMKISGATPKDAVRKLNSILRKMSKRELQVYQPQDPENDPTVAQEVIESGIPQVSA
jgi:hypothetical protein